MLLLNINKYGTKNFYKQIGLSQHFSFSGLLRRTQRQYPRLTKCLKFFVIFPTIVTSSMLLIPGANLPFQKQLKFWVCKKSQQFFNFWHMQSGVPNVMGYILAIYQLIFYQLNQGMYDPDKIQYFLKRINIVFEQENIKLYTIKDSSKIQNIAKSSLLLQKMISLCKLNKNNVKLLSDTKILDEFYKIVVHSGLKINNSIREGQKKNYLLIVKLFQYLLKFQSPENTIKVLQKLILLLKSKNRQIVALNIMKNQQIKNILKYLLSVNINYQIPIFEVLKIVQQYRKLNKL